MIGVRLKEERERLGLTQPAFAEIANAKKRTLIDWEKGISSPTAVQLSALSGAGVDVLYVLTGQRSASAAPNTQPLARDEEILLDNYRNSPPDARAAIKATSDAFARSARGSKRDKAA